MTIQYQIFPEEVLSDYIQKTFHYFKVPEEDARLAAEVLLYSDIRGIDSHGIARLAAYCHYLERGKINPKPTLSLVRERKSTATVDGDNGLGLVVAPKAMDIAMQKAKDCGSGWVAICNSNHYGAAGYYPEKALKQDLIGWSMTNTSKIVAPLWGIERKLGTNPIAIAFPGDKEPPIVIDFASSTVSFGKVEIQWRKGEALPEGWAIQKDGGKSSQPSDFLDGAALLPLGSDKIRGGHKGYGLSAMVDILSAVLSGANWGPFAPMFSPNFPDIKESVGKGLGHFLGAWDIDSFIDVQEFKQQIDHWIQIMRATKPMPDKEAVLIPGDPEREIRAKRKAEGIPIIQSVMDDLKELSTLTGVKL